MNDICDSIPWYRQALAVAEGFPDVVKQCHGVAQVYYNAVHRLSKARDLFVDGHLNKCLRLGQGDYAECRRRAEEKADE